MEIIMLNSGQGIYEMTDWEVKDRHQEPIVLTYFFCSSHCMADLVTLCYVSYYRSQILKPDD
jgi:hypothetical protein